MVRGSLLALVLVATPPLVGACSPGAAVPGATADAPAYLKLEAAPVTGTAPLDVTFHARLQGTLPSDAASGCPSAAWNFGDGNVSLQASACNGDDLESVGSHRFEQPGSYEVDASLLGADVASRSVIQVLVTGVEPTAAPEDVRRFPPSIVIATPGALPTTAAESRVAASGATAPAPSSPARSVAPEAVLPGDLYYRDATTGWVWRLSARGGAPEAVFAGASLSPTVGATGWLAVVAERGLVVQGEGGPGRWIATDGRNPVWSADGRVLAFASDRVHLYLPDDNRVLDTGARGRPLAVAPEGVVLVQDPAGALHVVHVPGAEGGASTGAATLGATRSGALAQAQSDFTGNAAGGIDWSKKMMAGALGAAGDIQLPPFADVASAGWLPGRPIVWLAGAGLRLLTLEDPLLVTTLSAPETEVTGVYVSGATVWYLARNTRGWEPRSIDLASDLAQITVGPPLEIDAPGQFAWGPDGVTAAAVRNETLFAVDAASGAELPLIEGDVEIVGWAAARP